MGFQYWGIDVNSFVGTPVSITATFDPAAKTMTTDGGSWYGADGTGVAGDGRYEPDQEWSYSLTSSSGLSGAANAFDGNLFN